MITGKSKDFVLYKVLNEQKGMTFGGRLGDIIFLNIKIFKNNSPLPQVSRLRFST